MAIINLQLDAGLSQAEAHRDILKESLLGELVTFDYNKRSGAATVTTRAFPAFPEVPPESDASKILNATLDSLTTIRAANDRDRVQLDKREADALNRERALDDRDAALVTSEKQREGELKELERLRKTIRDGKFTFVGGLKSFFHRIK